MKNRKVLISLILIGWLFGYLTHPIVDKVEAQGVIVGVPTADSTNNIYPSDVIGNKTDASQGTVGTTRSIIAYAKGVLTNFAVTSADSTSNTIISDVIGNKSDAAQQTVGTTRSVVAYIKALLTNYTTTRAGYIDNLSGGAVALDSTVAKIATVVDTSADGTFTFTSGTGNVYSAYTQLIASTGGASRAFTIQLSEQNAIGDVCNFAIATGGAGSETDLITFRFATGTLGDGVNFTIPFSIPASTRIAMRGKVGGGTGATLYGSFYVLR